MKKNYALIVVCLAMHFAQISYAQDEEQNEADTSNWIVGGEFALTFSQVSLTNWAAGGENSIALATFLSLSADYIKDRVKWENDLELGYGFLDQGDNGFRKSDDQIVFNTKLGYNLRGPWYWTSSLNLRTQFADGLLFPEDSVISQFFAPAYLTISSGLEYKPNDKFSAVYSPASGKITFVLDDDLAEVGAYGVDPGENVRTELGSYLRLNYKDEIVTNVNLDTKLELFTGYLDNAGEIDVLWDLRVIMKINKYLSTNLFTQLIYDEDIEFDVFNEVGEQIGTEARVQFKQVLGVGLSLKF
ncbi:MAG: DUF3078 domain-containing protein [Bacteroidota bacterium]